MYTSFSKRYYTRVFANNSVHFKWVPVIHEYIYKMILLKLLHIYRNICHIMVAVINWHYTSSLSIQMLNVNMIYSKAENVHVITSSFLDKRSTLKSPRTICGMPGVKSFKRRFSASQKYFTGRSGGLLITKIWGDLTCTATHSIPYLIVVYFGKFLSSKGHNSHKIQEIKISW
jgi:hypothetical protein